MELDWKKTERANAESMAEKSAKNRKENIENLSVGIIEAQLMRVSLIR